MSTALGLAIGLGGTVLALLYVVLLLRYMDTIPLGQEQRYRDFELLVWMGWALIHFSGWAIALIGTS